MFNEDNMKKALKNLEDSFNGGGKNDDVTRHEIKKGVNMITKNKDSSKTKVSDRKIGD